MGLAISDIKELLADREFAVIVARNQGKKMQAVADELGMSLGAVKSALSRARQKIESEYGVSEAEFRNLFVTLLDPQDNYALLPNIDELQEKLSPMEFEIFCLTKMGISDYGHIGRLIKTSRVTVRMLVIRIRKKLGNQYAKLLDDDTQIEGLKTIKQHQPESCTERTCQNCRHFWGTIESQDGKRTTCYSHGIINTSDEKTHSCPHHIRYITNLSEKDEMLEILNDKGYLRMAYNIGTGYETNSPIERSIYGASGAGYTDYHSRRKLKHRTLIDNSRYPVVVIEGKDRSRQDVRDILEHLNLKPSKVDYDLDDEGNEYSSAHYVVKEQRGLIALMQILIGEIDFYFAKNNLIISFEKKVNLKNLLINGNGKHQTITFDKQSKEHFSIDWEAGPGNYTLSLSIGGVSFRHEVEITECQGKYTVENYRLI